MKKAFFLSALLAFGCPAVSAADQEPFEMSEGMAAFNNDDWKQAVEYLSIAVQKDPGLWKAYQYLSYAYYERGDLPQALAACDKSLALRPDNGDLPGFRAKVQRDLQALSQAPPPPPPGGAPGTYPERCTFLYGGIGLTSPYDPPGFAQEYTEGYSMEGGAGIGISRQFSLLLDLGVDGFPMKSGAYPGYAANGGGITDVMLGLDAKFRFIPDDNPVVPYGKAGLGAVFYTTAPVNLLGPGSPPFGVDLPGTSNVEFSLRFALGIDIKLKPDQYLFLESDGVGISGRAWDFTYNVLRVGVSANFDESSGPSPPADRAPAKAASGD